MVTPDLRGAKAHKVLKESKNGAKNGKYVESIVIKKASVHD